MVSKKKIAFFDFCETLVNFQTADAFVDFVRQKMKYKRMIRLEYLRNCLYSLRVIQIWDLMTLSKYSINKKIKLFQLKGISKDELELLAKEYYLTIIKPHIIQPILEVMFDLQKNGYEVVLVSGGYDIYIKYFAEEYCVERVISTSIEFSDKNFCTGKIEGLDCLYKNKVKLIDKVYKKEEIVSIAFSDSVSDVPLLSWANEGYVISKGQHQRWLNDYNFKEIIWQV